MPRISPFTVDDFQKLCDSLLASTNLSKKELAQNLDLEPSYFSKLYNGKKPVPTYIIERVRQFHGGIGLSHSRKPPGGEDLPSREWLEGKFDQLTKQIALLQGGQTLMEDRVKGLEARLSILEAGEKKRTERRTHARPDPAHRKEKASR